MAHPLFVEEQDLIERTHASLQGTKLTIFESSFAAVGQICNILSSTAKIKTKHESEMNGTCSKVTK